ncbi:MAG: dTMP kinase [Candidatus Micrarchaeota archaeon]
MKTKKKKNAKEKSAKKSAKNKLEKTEREQKKRRERGRLIVFEGLDASGKHTQCVLLLAKLKSLGLRTAFYAFPAYDTRYGKLIARYLAGEFGPKDALSPKAVAALYALDRAQFRDAISRDLKSGKTVVCDRYVQSNLYQAAKLPREQRPKFEAWAQRLEASAPAADAVVFLDVPVARGREMLRKRGRKIDVHEADAAYQKEVQQEYLLAAKREKNWVVVECAARGRMLSREEIAERVWAALKKRGIL